MRLATLYLRSRLAGGATLLLLIIAGASWLWWSWKGDARTTIIMLPLAMPLAASAIIGASAGSPFGENEAAANDRLIIPRICHLSALLTLAALVLGLSVLGWNVQDSAWVMVRNVVGFSGLALIAARLLGSSLAWAAPLGYALLSLGDSQPGADEWWIWPAQPASDRLALLISVTLLFVGLAIIARRGAPRSVAEPA